MRAAVLDQWDVRRPPVVGTGEPSLACSRAWDSVQRTEETSEVARIALACRTAQMREVRRLAVDVAVRERERRTIAHQQHSYAARRARHGACFEQLEDARLDLEVCVVQPVMRDADDEVTHEHGISRLATAE